MVSRIIIVTENMNSLSSKSRFRGLGAFLACCNAASSEAGEESIRRSMLQKILNGKKNINCHKKTFKTYLQSSCNKIKLTDIKNSFLNRWLFQWHRWVYIRRWNLKILILECGIPRHHISLLMTLTLKGSVPFKIGNPYFLISICSFLTI